MAAKRWWLIAMVGMGVAIGWGASTMGTEDTATASILVRPSDATQTQQYVTQPARFVRSQIRITESDQVYAAASRELSDQTSVEQLRSSTTVSGGTLDDVIEVEARATSQGQARERAAAMADAFLSVTTTNASMLSLESESVEPSVARHVLGGGLIGLLIAVMGIVTATAMRRPVTSARDLQVATERTEVYPFDLPRVRDVSDAASSRFGLLLASLSNRGYDGARKVIVVDVGHASGQSVVDGLAGAARQQSWDALEVDGVQRGTGRSSGAAHLEVVSAAPAPTPIASGPVVVAQKHPGTRVRLSMVDPTRLDGAQLSGARDADVVIFAVAAHKTTERQLAEHLAAWRRVGKEHLVVVIVQD